MNSFWLNKHCILITGGGSGIGLGIATRLVKNGHKVIISGRREELLK